MATSSPKNGHGILTNSLSDPGLNYNQFLDSDGHWKWTNRNGVVALDWAPDGSITITSGGGGGGLPAGLTFVSPTFTIATGAANQLVAAGSTTGNPVSISAAGSDTDILVKIRGKGNGFLSVGPDTFGPSAGEMLEAYTAASTAASVGGVDFELSAGDIAGSTITTLILASGTQGIGATQDLEFVVPLHSFSSSDLPVGRTLDQLYGLTSNVDINGAGHVNTVFGSYLSVNNNAGTVDNMYGTYSNIGSQGGPTTNGFAFYSIDMGGPGDGFTNPYFLWFDSLGVFRVRSDKIAADNSLTQAVPALYNPRFAKYTPGAVNYERLILAQWNHSVAEIGTEQGGTGTLRDLRLMGASVIMGAPLTEQSVAFASLGTPADGSVLYCTDCDPTVTLLACTHAGAQTGAFAYRVNGAWKCMG